MVKSSRKLTNFLVVLFGVAVLAVTILLSWQTLFNSAEMIGVPNTPIYYSYPDRDLTEMPNPAYRIAQFQDSHYKYLEVYDSAAIASAGGTTTNPQPPAYKAYYTLPPNTPGSTARPKVPMLVVPLLPSSGYKYFDNASDSTAAYQLLTWAKEKSKGRNSTDNSFLTTAVDNYNQARLYASSTFRINQARNRVLTNDSKIVDPLIGAPEDTDPDVTADTIRGTAENPFDAFSVSINPDIHYERPTTNSLALRILSATSNEAARIGDSASKAKIDTAASNYRRQIPSSAESGGLSVSTVATLRNGEITTVKFSVDIGKLDLSKGALKTLLLNIDQKTFCTVRFNGESSSLVTSPNCTWDSSSKSGTFTWGPSTGQEMSTSNNGTRVVMLKAFSTAAGDNEIGNASKTVNVLPLTGEGPPTAGGGSIPLTVQVPRSVNKSDKTAAQSVQIKISARNLNPGGYAVGAVPPRVGKISWFVCPGTQVQRTNPSDDSTGCEKKEKFGPFGTAIAPQDSFTDKIVEWNASGTTPGTYVIMLKVFKLPHGKLPDGSPYYPDYPGTTKVISSDIAVVETMDEGGGSGGGDGDGGGSGNSGGSIDPPRWSIANFQESGLKTIRELVGRIGGFTLLTLGALAVIAIVMAGLKYITSGGDEKKAEVGKKALIYAVYGIIIATLCVVIVEMTVNEVKNIVAPVPGATDSAIRVPFDKDRVGPTAEIIDIIGQGNPDTGEGAGLAWNIIRLAALYAEVVAVFYVIFASYLYMMSFGDESKAEAGKKTLIWALIGLAVVMSANTLLKIFTDIVV